jgi:hypothetical protein
LGFSPTAWLFSTSWPNYLSWRRYDGQNGSISGALQPKPGCCDTVSAKLVIGSVADLKLGATRKMGGHWRGLFCNLNI